MSKLLTIQDKDRNRIEHLMKELHIKKQIDIVRAGLDLLEKEAERTKQINQWKRAASAVAKNSRDVNKEFQKHSRLKKS